MTDAEQVVRLAEVEGGVTRDAVKAALGWGSDRATVALRAAKERRPDLWGLTESAPRVSYVERPDGATLTLEDIDPSELLRSPDGYLRRYGVDTERWQIAEVKVVSRGDTGTTNIHIRLKAKLPGPMTPEEVRAAVMSAIADLEPTQDAPTPPPAAEGGHLLELALPDLHIGKLAWGAETGDSYDLHIAASRFQHAVSDLLSKAAGFPLDSILFVLGNDLLHVDNAQAETTRGTRQDIDGRWQKAFRKALELMVWGIDRMLIHAPVKVIVMPGNHASVLEHVMGETLAAWYRNTPAVEIDTSPRPRKYHRFGATLLGFAHGHNEKPDDLPLIMAEEVPELWASSRYREWHTGHLHQRRTTRTQVLRESHGVAVRISPALCSDDAWHAAQGYTGNLKAAEAYVYHPDNGLTAQFLSRVQA